MLGWIITTVAAGVFNGSFGLPMKFTTKWKWENTWSMWSVWTLLFVPWTIALVTIPNLLQVYREASWGALSSVFLFGLIWGVSAIMFGTGLDYLGLALGYSLMMGLIIAVGSLLPLVTENPGAGYFDKLLEPGSLTIMIGVAILIAGVIINARAAVMKERDLADSASANSAAENNPAEKKSFTKGLIICLIAGTTAPMLNYAFIYGDQLRATAQRLGAHETLAPNVIWVVTLFAGFLVNITYCCWLVTKNGVWRLYRVDGTRPYYLYTLIMGILWAGSIAVYGMAAANLGELGASIGWAIFNGMAIFWANLLGVLTGEWKGARRQTMQVMAAGLAILLVGICVVGWAKTISAS